MAIAASVMANVPALANDAPNASASGRLVQSPLDSASLLNTAMGLVIVIAVMLALAWLVKRFVRVPGLGKGQIQVLGGVSLGARERAVLLSVEGRRLLVGVAPGRVQTLVELGESQEASDEFARQLDTARGGDPEASA